MDDGSIETVLDPVDYAVISQGLLASAREMGVKLVRSSYSNIIREAQDGSAALFDRHGNVVAQAELIPMQLGPMSDIFRACAAVIPPETLKPGDFYINNDPYKGGTHINDITFCCCDSHVIAAGFIRGDRRNSAISRSLKLVIVA